VVEATFEAEVTDLVRYFLSHTKNKQKNKQKLVPFLVVVGPNVQVLR
jgi:hypothetical protein